MMRKNPYPGKFIVMEGIDGAGKSTQAAVIANYFSQKNVGVCLTSEPSQFMVGGLIRSLLLGEWSSSPECLQLMFAADRAEHLEKEILPRLKEGINVVSDRYFLSSIAYGAIECDLEWLVNINSPFLMPDLTIYLDIDAATAAKRIIDNGRSIELFEKAEVLDKVRRNYETSMEMFRGRMAVEVVDCRPSKEKVFESIEKILEKILK